jgi:hypothetical protein
VYPTFEFTEFRNRLNEENSVALDFNSRGTLFESRPRYRLSVTYILVVSLRFYRRISVYYLELDQLRLLPNPYIVTIYDHLPFPFDSMPSLYM